MRAICVVAITCGFVLIPCIFVLADEQPAQLPEDGWWIRYSATTTLESDGKIYESPIKCKLTYSLVGTAIEDGEKCRWVELEDACPPTDTDDTNSIGTRHFF